MIYPDKLQRGDEIRILAPSDSMSSVSKLNLELAKTKLQSFGYKVTFGRRSFEKNSFNQSSSIEARVEDLHVAFRDQNVKMILPVIGGYNSNQILDSLDWDIIKHNPKILGGYSDTTALQNAIFAKTNIVTYSSVAFVMMAKSRNNDYSFYSFLNCLTLEKKYQLSIPEYWDDSQWYIDQNNYDLFADTELQIINKGKSSGIIIGGNLGTLRLLQGTEYFPKQEQDFIYFLEECQPSKANDFDRELQSLLHASNLKNLKGLVIGRFQPSSKISSEILKTIISQYPILDGIPVIANAPFGHTYPIATFPIGGLVSLDTDSAKIIICKH